MLASRTNKYDPQKHTKPHETDALFRDISCDLVNRSLFPLVLSRFFSAPGLAHSLAILSLTVQKQQTFCRQCNEARVAGGETIRFEHQGFKLKSIGIELDARGGSGKVKLLHARR
jgi:hypothetical protein